MSVEKLEIDDDVVKKTMVCHNKFACLSGQPPCCTIERYVGEGVFFIKDSSCDCLYKIPFGFSNGLCACPVRREIFRRYGK
jgi:hypothetical protein